MALKLFNLDVQPDEGYTMMVYGGRATGKTHLLGDMLREEAKQGKVLYVNIAGEDGMKTIKNIGLGNVGVEATEFNDLEDLIAKLTKEPVHAIAIDSLRAVAKLANRRITGSDRAPIVEPKGRNEWGELHTLMESTCIRLRHVAKYVVLACPADKSVAELDLADKAKADHIAPDLPGKEAVQSAGWFDFVGRLEIKSVRPQVFARTFNMVPDNVNIVRQRVPSMIKEPIVIPDGQGGWVAIKTKISEAMK